MLNYSFNFGFSENLVDKPAGYQWFKYSFKYSKCFKLPWLWKGPSDHPQLIGIDLWSNLRPEEDKRKEIHKTDILYSHTAKQNKCQMMEILKHLSII